MLLYNSVFRIIHEWEDWAVMEITLLDHCICEAAGFHIQVLQNVGATDFPSFTDFVTSTEPTVN